MPATIRRNAGIVGRRLDGGPRRANEVGDVDRAHGLDVVHVQRKRGGQVRFEAAPEKVTCIIVS